MLYTPEEILARHNRALIEQFKRNANGKKFADKLFDAFKNEPDSDDEEGGGGGAGDEAIEEKLVEFLAEIGVDAATVVPAVVFWQMSVKG